jgi:cell division protein FtsI (penicillin-binding protein 3)
LARRRLTALSIALLLAFSVLSVRLVQLQALSGAQYEKLALAQRLDRVTLPAARGSIFDRDGRDLALSVDKPTAWANPRVVTDPKYYAAQLSPLVGVKEATLARRLGDRTRQFVYIARRLDDDTAARVRALRLPGVAFIDEPDRQYPAGSVAAPLIGMVGGEGTGLSGLEHEYQHVLAGKPGEVVSERDVQGREIPRTVRHQTPARRGTDLVLTVDEALQYRTERTLVDQVGASGAKGGMAVVLDVHTGDVLAMATAVGGGPGQAARPANDTESNRPLTSVFEPGSTNKVITIASAIEHGVVTPGTWFDVAPTYTVAGHTYHDDDHPPGVVRWTTSDIVRESSNVGTIQIAKLLGKDRLDAALRAFGLGQKTALQFPGQTAGLLLPPDKYYATGLSSAAIGYGVSVSAQQMLDVYATIANGGETVPPRLVQATIDADGVEHAVPIAPGTRVVSTETASAVTQMLSGVVRGGTGACAAIPGYTVAGKTGTSRKALDTGGYSDKYMASFVGYAPAEAPRIATIVVLDEPVQIYGGRVAAPAFAEITGFALQLLRVAPPPGDNSQFADAMATAQTQHTDCRVPHGADLARAIAARGRQAQQQAAAAAQRAAAAQTAKTAAVTGTAAGTLPRTPANPGPTEAEAQP